MLTWPHENSDWNYMLEEVTSCFMDIAKKILSRERLIIVCDDAARVNVLFNKAERKNLELLEIPSNDTWARDHGPVFFFRDGIPVLADFAFNGWGNKFPAEKDNKINLKLFEAGVFHHETEYIDCNSFVFEGGSFDTDGNGRMLTTSECLLSPERNPDYSKSEIQDYLSNVLGIDEFLWLNSGYLSGDDTDGHIDTLARFCNENTIVYTRCTDFHDENFEQLSAMEAELKLLKNREGKPYNLIPLPLPSPLFDENGFRLPATYANFLIINSAVLVPVYGVPEDISALNLLSEIFYNREVSGINCLPLIKQHGSLHCVTMQLPKGVLK